MIKKTGFVLAINLDGNIRETYNCCGLGDATIEEAIKDGLAILEDNKKRNIRALSKYPSMKAIWESVKPVYVKYIEVNEKNHVISANNIVYI